MIKFIDAQDYNEFISFIKESHPEKKIIIFDEEEKDFQEILEEIYSSDIFGDTRILAIRNADKIIKSISDFETEDIVYIQAKKISRKIKSQKIKTVDITLYIKSLFKEYEIKENYNIINHLRANFEKDRVTIRNEFIKIVNYIYPKKIIDNPDDLIQNIITKNNNTVIWDLMESINSNNKKGMFIHFESLKGRGEDARVIISMIIRQIQIIIFINELIFNSDKTISERLKKPPFKINISEYGVGKVKKNRYDNQKLKNIYHKLINLYSLSNEGKFELELGLTLFMLSL